MTTKKEIRRNKLKWGIRKKITGSDNRPRLTVFRSNKEMYAQLVDDISGRTLATASSLEKTFEKKGNKSEVAKAVGNLIAVRAKVAGIEEVVFDRNGYLYHGRVKSLADAARENGLKF